MIKEYSEKYFNYVNVLGREISSNYILNLSPVSKCFVYEEDEEIVGFILIDLFDDRAEVIDIAVSLLYRNKKIGDKLLKHIIEICKNKGCENITLEVKVNNQPAIKLYKNNGFKISPVNLGKPIFIIILPIIKKGNNDGNILFFQISNEILTLSITYLLYNKTATPIVQTNTINIKLTNVFFILFSFFCYTYYEVFYA